MTLPRATKMTRLPMQFTIFFFLNIGCKGKKKSFQYTAIQRKPLKFILIQTVIIPINLFRVSMSHSISKASNLRQR